MGKSKLNIIECDGLHIAATLETNDCEQKSTYYPANFLIYVERGQLKLTVDGIDFILKEGEFGFVRKYTHGVLVKSWEEFQGSFRDHIFVLHDVFIREVIRDFEIPDDYLPCTVPMVKFSDDPVLKGLMKSIDIYITGQAKVDRDLIRMKTKEALHALTSLKPELIHIFNEFSKPVRAELEPFIEHNYTKNLTLDQFATLSGRSLSTFTRDFKKEFNEAPYKWLKTKRLELARKLLSNPERKASDVYLEVGFEDLGHFSRSFKNHFGINPSEYRQQAMV